MMMRAICRSCGSDRIAMEFRNWFEDELLPPREASGIWLVCTDCGEAWQDREEYDYE